jgi:hypothetical protein
MIADGGSISDGPTTDFMIHRLQDSLWGGIPWTRVTEWLLAAFVIFVVFYVLAGAIFVALPRDAFVRMSRESSGIAVPRVVQKSAGAILVVLGLFLSLPGIPGPGFVFVILGLAFLGVLEPKTLVRLLVRNARLMERIDRLRKRFGQPPFDRPD